MLPRRIGVWPVRLDMRMSRPFRYEDVPSIWILGQARCLSYGFYFLYKYPLRDFQKLNATYEWDGLRLPRPRLRAGFPAHPAHIILRIFLFGSPYKYLKTDFLFSFCSKLAARKPPSRHQKLVCRKFTLKLI